MKFIRVNIKRSYRGQKEIEKNNKAGIIRIWILDYSNQLIIHHGSDNPGLLQRKGTIPEEWKP